MEFEQRKFRCIYFPLSVGSSVVSWLTDKIPSEDYAKSVFCISFIKIINVLIIISEWYVMCSFAFRWLKRLRRFCSIFGYFCYIVTRAFFHCTQCNVCPYFLRLKETIKVKTASKTTRNYFKSNLKVCFVKKWVLAL